LVDKRLRSKLISRTEAITKNRNYVNTTTDSFFFIGDRLGYGYPKLRYAKSTRFVITNGSALKPDCPKDTAPEGQSHLTFPAIFDNDNYYGSLD
jgi:hypothetical protein